jgi:hypothetical protein
LSFGSTAPPFAASPVSANAVRRFMRTRAFSRASSIDDQETERAAGQGRAGQEDAQVHVALLAEHPPDGTGLLGERGETLVADIVGAVLQPFLGGV